MGMSENNASLATPQLNPVFSYGVDIGEINVYLVNIRAGKIAVATFQDRVDEEAYAAQTLTSITFDGVQDLVEKARKAWDRSIPSPFAQLWNDEQALLRLAEVLTQFFESE